MEDVIGKIEKLTLEHDKITPELVREKDVKLGLRNRDGTGVVVGITKKGRVVGYEKTTDKGVAGKIPAKGKLFYCGYDVEKIVKGLTKEKRFGFDEAIYLLLTGELAKDDDLRSFSEALAKRRTLSRMERGVIMEEVQNENQMYGLHSVISHLGRCDAHADSLDITDVSRQCVNLIAKFPTIVAYNYNVMRFRKGADLRMLRPKAELSTAENFLYMLKGSVPDSIEAHLFDIALILHVEHGGGNNSTFTVRSVSSAGANTYMAIAAGIASLSGHLHGGANESVMDMMKKVKKNVNDWSNDNEIRKYLISLLDDKRGSGKLYGFGHAVYTKSDPRAEILREYSREFSRQRGAYDEFQLYEKVEVIARNILAERKEKEITSNVDFYSGFIYKLMGIPKELFTPVFSMARVVGWSAHRLEQIIQGKIMRPAYITASTEEEDYIQMGER